MLSLRPSFAIASLLFGVGSAAVGCATNNAITDPPLEVAIEVSNVDQRQRNLIEAHVCSFEGVAGCTFDLGATLAPALTPKGEGPPEVTAEADSGPTDAKKATSAKKGAKRKSSTRRSSTNGAATGKKSGPAASVDPEAKSSDDVSSPSLTSAIDPDLQKVTGVLSFRYSGRIDQLRYHIGQLPHPGLTPKVARTALSFDGFDNTSPTVAILKPKNGLVLTTAEVEVEVDVPDFDIKTVVVNTTQASFAPTGHYHATLPLDDGTHTISVAALDESGNETARSVTITVDTTPPALTVKVTKVSDTKMNLRGSPGDAESLTLDGKALKFGDFYQKLVDIDPDKKTATLVATDAHGNKTTLIVPLEDGTALPAVP